MLRVLTTLVQSTGKHALLLTMTLALGRTVNDQSAAAIPSPSTPPYKQLRYDEDYRFLQDLARHTDLFDPVKYVPFDDGKWWATLGGEVRLRYEYFENPQWGAAPQDKDGYLMQRYMIHGDVHFLDAFRLFTQFKSGLIEDREGGPRPTDQDDFDLHQLFVDGRLAWGENADFTLRVGRQEMSYGSSRLVSFREGPNARLSFDGVKSILKAGDWQVDAFAANPVRIKTGVFDDDPNPEQNFWGLYVVTPVSWMPGGNADLYYLGLDRKNASFDQGTSDELRHSVGTRIWGRKAGWDYNLEFVYQFGSFGSGDIQAWTAASDVGFTFENAPLKPRLGLKANVTSGDGNPNDADLQTFNPLFPRGAYFGEPALIGPANHIDVHPSLDLALRRNLALNFNWDCFWRESTGDGVYGPAVNLIQSGQTSNARYVGNQTEVMLGWQLDRHITLTADYAHFFAGDFLKETTPGKDVDYFSAWITFRF